MIENPKSKHLRVVWSVSVSRPKSYLHIVMFMPEKVFFSGLIAAHSTAKMVPGTII